MTIESGHDKQSHQKRGGETIGPWYRRYFGINRSDRDRGYYVRDPELRCANKSATPASATGSAHDQSPSNETAAAPTRQPAKNPATSPTVFFNCSPAFCISGSFRHRVSSNDSVVLVKLPVITAVEGAPGTARRKRANWHAIAETTIMAMMPAMNP